jgi:ribosomal protein S18 acetylase RimI-like enzyme
MLELTSNPRLEQLQPQGVQKLTDSDAPEVLDFLSRRPLNTFIMASFVRENGMTAPALRGEFYAYRNAFGALEGVALIGHLILLETNSDAAMRSFARLAQACRDGQTVLGEWTKIGKFLDFYSHGAPTPRLLNRQLLMERNQPISLPEHIRGLRLATSADLDLVVPVHAQLAFEESGVNPLEKDSAGFRERCAQRIEKGRVWVVTQDNQLHFKADVVAETPEVIYIEGIYVGTNQRGQGFGAHCLAQMTNELLAQSDSVCLFANLRNHAAQKCYSKAGYTLREYYDSLYLQQTATPA